MGKKIHKSSSMQSDAIESSDTEQAWRALARIIARRHIKNQFNKIKGENDENIINHDGNNKMSKA